MPIDAEFKKLTKWADTGDRTDPDDSALTPTLTRAEGYPSSFSADMGDTPRRRVMNQLLREISGAAVDVREQGILAWDTDVDYLQHAIVRSGTALYRATVATGPDTSNATDPTASGQSVWSEVSGTTGAPSAPSAPQAVGPASGELDWFWNCPLDGGAQVTSFNVRYRTAGTAAWQPDATGDSVTTARYALTGLTNGTAIEAQVQAVNSVGTSPWSSTGSATPSGTVPGGGATLALRAEAGDGEVDLDWLEPDDGGVTITSYLVQWRTGNQGYSTGRQQTETGTTATVGSLTNDTQYFFRVRAVNGEGNGAWSGDASATPVADTVTPTPPADTAPDAPTNLSGTGRRPLTVDWTWELPDDDGGEPVESFDHQWRYQGDAWSGNITSGLERTCQTHTIADTTNGVQARVRATNSVGSSSWTTAVTISQSDIEDDSAQLPQRTAITSSQTYSWPYGDAERAIIELRGRESGLRDASQDISLASASWNSAVSDGTTLWIVNSSNNAVAYVAATGVRDSAKDISLGSGSIVGGAVSDGTTLWFARNRDVTAYVAATRARDAAKDFTLGEDANGAASDGTTLWFVNNSSNRAQAYTAATQARDSGKDITLASGFWLGAVCDGVTIWFVNTTTNAAVAYDASDRSREAGRDIDLSSTDWSAAASDGLTVWFVDTLGNEAIAFTGGSIAEVTANSNDYTSDGEDNAVLLQAVTSLSLNESLVFTLSGAAEAAIYPQF